MAKNQSDGRHNDVVNQRIDDLAEGDAHNDADRHIEHVAAQRKLAELLQNAFAPAQHHRWATHMRSEILNRDRLTLVHSFPRFRNGWMLPLNHVRVKDISNVK